MGKVEGSFNPRWQRDHFQTSANYISNLEGCVCNLFKCGSGLDLVAVASSLGGWLLLSLEGEEQPPILPPVYLLHSDHLRLLLISRDLLNPII